MAIPDWLHELHGAGRGQHPAPGRPSVPRCPRHSVFPTAAGDDADGRDKMRQRRAPEVGGFFPGRPGSFSERTIQDRCPAYTVATATKGTSGC